MSAQLKPVIPRQRLIPIPWSEIHCLPRREPIIGGLLDRAAMSVVFGGSNTGKTFFTLDLSACIALDREWRGRKVRHGAVVYIAAEGGLGIEERLTAYRLHHDVKTTGVPLYVIPEPIDLCKSDTDVNLLLQRLAALPAEPSIELIVIDTLSRALAGGNENGADDMGAFVRHCDRLRAVSRAHVLVIHHAGKDEGRGARGHSLLRAAADTEIEVSKSELPNVATAEVVKQRDRLSGDKFSFALKSLDIGQDDDGAPVTSCVVVVTDRPAGTAKKANLPKAAVIALRALAEAVDEQGKPSTTGAPQIPSSVKVVSQDEMAAAILPPRHQFLRGSPGQAVGLQACLRIPDQCRKGRKLGRQRMASGMTNAVGEHTNNSLRVCSCSFAPYTVHNVRQCSLFA